jgi:hypothetical protein
VPTLPTLNVTDAQMARIVAAYGTAANYRTKLREWVRDTVVAHEVGTVYGDADTQADNKRREIDDDLGGIS